MTEPAAATALGGAEPAPATEPAAAPAAAAPAPAAEPAAATDGKQTNGQDPNGAGGKVGAPEKYEDFKLPDGLEVNKEVLDKFVPMAKELNLSQEQAQKLVDLQSEYVQHVAKAQQQAFDGMLQDWVKTAKADAEIGGLAFNENVAHAAKALKQFGTPALREALDTTGVGNHPEFIRVFAKIGKAISEDKLHVSNAENPPAPKSWAEALFPNQGKQ